MSAYRKERGVVAEVGAVVKDLSLRISQAVGGADLVVRKECSVGKSESEESWEAARVRMEFK